MIAIRKLYAEKKILAIQHADVRNLLLQHCLMNDSVASQTLKS